MIRFFIKRAAVLFLTVVVVPAAILLLDSFCRDEDSAFAKAVSLAVQAESFTDAVPAVKASENNVPIQSVTAAKRSEADRIGGVVYFCTREKPWSDGMYGSDTLKDYSCGPTTMAMAVSTLSDAYVDPIEMCQWSVSHGFWRPGGGTYTAFMREAPKAFGLSCKERYWSLDVIREEIENGNLIIFTVGRGAFTNGSHFLMIRGVSEDGELFLCDSYSRSFSEKEWSFSEITAQLQRPLIWVIGKE